MPQVMSPNAADDPALKLTAHCGFDFYGLITDFKGYDDDTLNVFVCIRELMV